MGMFLDFRRPSREEWKYTYKGSELIAAAKAKLAEVRAEYLAAQEECQRTMAASPQLYKDDKVQKCREAVEKLGPEMESCQVWVHEFQRTPDREFILAMSDVTYLNLHLTGA
jgi:hypothetical protein